MFDRAYIKELAKQRMSGWLGNAILVGLIASILAGLNSSGIGYSFGLRFGNMSDETFNPMSHIFNLMFPLFAAFGLITIAYVILVANVIRTGTRGWYLRYWRGEYPMVGELFAGFRIFAPCVKTGLLRSVYVFLWSLLFIIPGFVMSYAYSMADYLIYENPNLPASRALEMSKAMTQGFKGQLFVFDLSYIGWGLLSACTCGILGIVYVNPYMFTAHAGIYETLKNGAIQRGVLTPADFGMTPPPPPPPYGGYPQGNY